MSIRNIICKLGMLAGMILIILNFMMLSHELVKQRAKIKKQKGGVIKVSIDGSVTKQELQIIWREMKKHAGAEYRNMPLEFVNDGKMNAYATCGFGPCRIIITEKFLKFFRNKHEAAYIMGHELGHHVLGHTNFSTPSHQMFKELNSDRMAIVFMLQSGMDICKGRLIWQRMIDHYGEIIRPSSHPTFAQRLAFSRLPQCSR